MNMDYEEEEEDFSFPIFLSTQNQATAEAVSSIDSPPLWHLSPATSPVHSSNKQQQQQQNYSPEAKPEDYEDEEEEEEEKMDILWEDFNMTEELLSKSKRNPNTIYSSAAGDLKLSKNYKNTTNYAIFSSRKPKVGIFVFIKLLKKLVLLHNSHHHHHHHHHPCI